MDISGNNDQTLGAGIALVKKTPKRMNRRRDL